MRQPIAAPIAAGGGVVGGLAAMLLSGYFLVDCFRYESGRGACDDAVREHTLPLVAGAAAIAGTIGGLFTYNRRLDRPGRSDEDERNPLGAGHAPGDSWSPAETEASLRQAFRQAIAEGLVDSLPTQSLPAPIDPRREVYLAGAADEAGPVQTEPASLGAAAGADTHGAPSAEDIARRLGMNAQLLRSILDQGQRSAGVE